MFRVSKLNVDVPRDIIVVEKFDYLRNCIMKGSRIYCGCCGEIMGECIRDMEFPFNSMYLSQYIGYKNFYVNRLGLYHIKCGYTMFQFYHEFSFIEIDSYFNEVYKQRVSKGIGLN